MKYLIIMLLSFPALAQNYVLGAGMVIPKDKEYNAGYYIEADYIIEINLNRKMIFGFSHAGYMTDNIVKIGEKEVKTEKINCNCTETDIKFSESNYIEKRMVRAISLVFGFEVLERLYLTTGITSSKHITKINGEEVSSFYSSHIDAGAKYFIKINKGFLTLNTKFNPEYYSFGLAYGR